MAAAQTAKLGFSAYPCKAGAGWLHGAGGAPGLCVHSVSWIRHLGTACGEILTVHCSHNLPAAAELPGCPWPFRQTLLDPRPGAGSGGRPLACWFCFLMRVRRFVPFAFVNNSSPGYIMWLVPFFHLPFKKCS